MPVHNNFFPFLISFLSFSVSKQIVLYQKKRCIIKLKAQSQVKRTDVYLITQSDLPTLCVLDQFPTFFFSWIVFLLKQNKLISSLWLFSYVPWKIVLNSLKWDCSIQLIANGYLKFDKSLNKLFQVIIDSQPLTVAVLASLLFGESIGFVGAAGLVLGVIGLLLLEVLV